MKCDINDGASLITQLDHSLESARAGNDCEAVLSIEGERAISVILTRSSTIEEAFAFPASKDLAPLWDKLDEVEGTKVFATVLEDYIMSREDYNVRIVGDRVFVEIDELFIIVGAPLDAFIASVASKLN